MIRTGQVPSENYLEEHRMEIENRIRNLFWTVSGDYSRDIIPDADTFAFSPAMALYDAVKQGAFAKHFNTDRLISYCIKKCACGADEKALTELMQLCTDAAAYPQADRERKGVCEIRKQALSDYLANSASESGETDAEKKIFKLKQASAGRFLGKEYTLTPDLEAAFSEIGKLSDAGNTDCIIDTLDRLYNTLIDPEFEKKNGTLSEILSVSVEELLERNNRELSDEQIKTVMDQYMDALKQEMHRMKSKQVRHNFKPAARNTDAEDREPDPKSAEKVKAYIEKSFGKSCMTPVEQEQISNRLCTGIHSKCTLYFTSGILQNPAKRNTQFLRNEMQAMKNRLYFDSKRLSVKRSIDVLSSTLKRVRIMKLDEDSTKSDYGRIAAERLWKVGRTDDTKLFDLNRPHEDTSFAVAILIDGSSSQITRQPQIATQAYIISQSLSLAGIPHKVASYCSYWDYTLIHSYRSYDDNASVNENILQFHAFGENRDGLAVKALCDDLSKRNEDSKILILLSDGRPSHINVHREGSRNLAPYFGEDAIKDTALEIRKARNSGISILGIFSGAEEDLYVEKRIFGKEFAYTKNISSFSRIVGNYLKRMMEQE